MATITVTLTRDDIDNGLIGDSEDCAIARGLLRSTNGMYGRIRWSVHSERLIATWDDENGAREVKHIPTPKKLQRFIEKYDVPDDEGWEPDTVQAYLAKIKPITFTLTAPWLKEMPKKPKKKPKKPSKKKKAAA